MLRREIKSPVMEIFKKRLDTSAGDDGVELSVELCVSCSSVSVQCLRSVYIFNANETLSKGWDMH